MFESKKGEMNSTVLYLIVAIILLIGVGIPVANEVIDTANLSGLTETVVTYIPVFLAVGCLVLIAKSVM